MAGLKTNVGSATINLGAAAPGMVGRTTIHIETFAAAVTVEGRGNGSTGTYRACKVMNSLDPAAVAAASIVAVGVYHVEGDLELRIIFPAGTTVYSVSQTGSG